MSHVGAPSATSINPGPATSRLPRYDREYFRRLLGKSFGSFALMGLHEERTERRSVPNGVLARRTISAVARIVDPSPIIEQRLIEVAAEYEPRLAVLRESIDSESARRAWISSRPRTSARSTGSGPIRAPTETDPGRSSDGSSRADPEGGSASARSRVSRDPPSVGRGCRRRVRRR